MVGIDMAIIIPSSKTYDRQNPKVRDNVIERIEVGAVEVVPDNEYETPVFNKAYFNLENSNGNLYDNLHREVDSGVDKVKEIFVYHSIRGNYSWLLITIPKLTLTKYISMIKDGYEENGNPNIMCNIKYSIYDGIASATAYYNPDTMLNEMTGLKYDYHNQKTESNQTNKFKPPLEYKYTTTMAGFVTEYITVKSKIDFDDLTDVSGKLNFEETNEKYQFNVKLLSGYEEINLIGERAETSENWSPKSVPLSGQCKKYVPEQIEITVYGNTIGIDLTDKTVHIKGETAKKVHGIDGNELMQTSNYYQSTDTNAITRAFTNTQAKYAKGKETATIRCSISDYYDYDDQTKKVIAIDNSTKKMVFEEYDQVIPMVYGADGKDRPMSTYQIGSPKVFQVLGSKIFYDGAVWQELSLQET